MATVLLLAISNIVALGLYRWEAARRRRTEQALTDMVNVHVVRRLTR